MSPFRVKRPRINIGVDKVDIIVRVLEPMVTTCSKGELEHVNGTYVEIECTSRTTICKHGSSLMASRLGINVKCALFRPGYVNDATNYGRQH